MCPLCEEPLRSVLIALAAIGVVAIVRTVQQLIKRKASSIARADNAS